MEKVLDNLELKIPPLAQGLLIAALMWLLARWLGADTSYSAFWSLLVMLVLVAGIALGALSVLTLYMAKTAIDPRYPHKTVRLITQGIYGYSRNPVYLGLLVMLLAWNLYLDSLYATPGLPLFVAMITFLQIIPEERILTRQFGDSYQVYCRTVRRWL